MDKQSSIQGRETTSAEVSWATLPRMLSGECSRSETMGMDEEASRRGSEDLLYRALRLFQGPLLHQQYNGN